MQLDGDSVVERPLQSRDRAVKDPEIGHVAYLVRNCFDLLLLRSLTAQYFRCRLLGLTQELTETFCSLNRQSAAPPLFGALKVISIRPCREFHPARPKSRLQI
jgi:hypothetical protein